MARTTLSVWIIVAALGASPSPAQRTSSRTLAADTPYETKAIIRSAGPGPTVLLLGGIHGNEPAGARAVGQIARWTLRRGTLVCVPRANVPALDKGQRRMPGLPRDAADLNRQFPAADGEGPRGVLATALWEFIQEIKPDWVLDCHEGYDFTQENPKSVGSSIIAVNLGEARRYARRMLDPVNARIDAKTRRFVLKKNPVIGSLIRSAHDRLGIPGMILETTTKDQRLPKRVRQHRLMVRRFLLDQRMVAGESDRVIPERAPDGDVRVAVLDDVGCNVRGVRALERALRSSSEVRLRRVDGADVRAHGLKGFSALLVPGGGASKEAASLGAAGRARVRSFVKAGGGYMGFCAGAYLASTNYPWSLKIIDYKVIDRKHWARGRGRVAIDLTSSGRTLFRGRGQRSTLHYANGPLLAPGDDPAIPDYEVLAHYRSEINKDGAAPEGIMLGTPAMVRGRFGRGRVFCSSPHPELTEGAGEMVAQALAWVCGARHR